MTTDMEQRDSTQETGTIMLVDDMPVNIKLLEKMLRLDGHQVMSFSRGAPAIEAAAESPPDLILLDITMPEMDGFEVCARLKADAALREIPVIFISALAGTEEKVHAFDAGGVDYVTKPFQIQEVRARVQTHLRLRRMQAELTSHNQRLNALVEEKVREISESQMATIMALANLAECRDDDTGLHIERTSSYCRALARALRSRPSYADSIDDAFIDNLYNAAPLHDIGKVGISDAILLKPARLTPEEFETMKTHTVIGERTLRTAQIKYPRNAFINMGVAIARSHHERWDGSGYPDGLEGDAIPVSARIMALADVYDALCSRRVYKEAFSHEESRRIIEDGAGKHFDPVMVAAFVDIEYEFAHIRAELNDDFA